MAAKGFLLFLAIVVALVAAAAATPEWQPEFITVSKVDETIPTCNYDQTTSGYLALYSVGKFGINDCGLTITLKNGDLQIPITLVGLCAGCITDLIIDPSPYNAIGGNDFGANAEEGDFGVCDGCITVEYAFTTPNGEK